MVVHDIGYERLIGLENLFSAWDEFKKGKTKKSDVIDFERHLEDNIFLLRDELQQQIYRRSPYTQFSICDPKPRLISKAVIRDRLVHHIVFQKLYEIFNPIFIYHSYACRLGKGTHLAVRNLAKALRQESCNYRKPVFALKCDIKKFFQSVNHQILLQLIQNKISDKKFLWLVQEIIQSFGNVDKFPQRERELKGKISSGKSLPIGNLTSQIFANIYLNELDQFVKHTLKAKHYFRYADDFVIVSRDMQFLNCALRFIAEFLESQLELQLHPNKVYIRKFRQGIDFLGYVILPHYIVLRAKTRKRMFKKLFEKQTRLQHGQIGNESYYQTLQSYLGMVKHCNGYGIGTFLKNNFFSSYEPEESI